MLLYGSRAKGNYKTGSDIDLTLIGKNLNPDDSIYPLQEELNKLYLPYTFDISILSKLDLEFISHIIRVGKTFYQKETNELPAGWQKKKLGDVCEFYRGLTYTKNDEVSFSKNIVLRANNISLLHNKLNFEELKYIQNKIKIKNEKIVKKGALLICTASGSKKHLGKIALIDKNYNYAFGGFMGQLIPNKNILSKYFYYCLITDSYKNFIKNLSDGTNINNLKFKDLQIFKIPLPPLAEQKRIVAILDKTFTTIDKIKNNTEKNLANTKELWQSYLQQSFNNPKKNWQQKKLGDVCEIIAGQSPEGKYYNNENQGLAFYQGKKEFTKKFIGKPVKWTTKITKEAIKNDILMSVRAPVGPVNFSTGRICIGRGLAIIRAGKKMDKEFLFNFLVMQENKIIGNTGTVFNSISKSQIEAIQIPIPPLAEQKQITERLDYLSQKTTALQETYCKKIQNLIELKNSLLQKAFSGEL